MHRMTVLKKPFPRERMFMRQCCVPTAMPSRLSPCYSSEGHRSAHCTIPPRPKRGFPGAFGSDVKCSKLSWIASLVHFPFYFSRQGSARLSSASELIQARQIGIRCDFQWNQCLFFVHWLQPRRWKLGCFIVPPVVPIILREQCHLIGISICSLCLGYSLSPSCPPSY